MSMIVIPYRERGMRTRDVNAFGFRKFGYPAVESFLSLFSPSEAYQCLGNWQKTNLRVKSTSTLGQYSSWTLLLFFFGLR